MPRVQVHDNPAATSLTLYAPELEVSNWRHRITATIGFDTASFTVQDSKYILEDIWANALGRRICRYTPDGNFLIWEGYINEMTLTEPGIQKTISLRDLYNRVGVRYIPIDTAANPPTESAETVTAAVDNTASQALFGIKEIVFRPPKINRLITAEAEQQANTILLQYRMPRRSDDIRTGGEPGLSVSCEGYMHTLKWRKYNQTATSGNQDADLEIADIITSVGQFIASTALTSNGATQIQEYFNRDDTAFDIIQQIAAMGGSDYARWVAYVMEGRKLYYEAASTSIAYYRRVADGRQEFFDLQYRAVPYWEVRPNKWVRTTDIFPHQLTPASLQDDKQATYIESVEWTEPDSISITGSPGDAVQVMVARLANRGDVLL